MGVSHRPETWRHVRTGGLYTVLSRDALVEATLERVVVYQAAGAGQVWVRPEQEFLDGRFVREPREP